MTQQLRAIGVRQFLSCLCILIITVILLNACDENTETKKRQSNEEAQRQAQLQAQLEIERTRRLCAEQSARAAEESRNKWLVGLGAGACIACVIAGLVGVHIGVQGASRAREKEMPHE